MGRTIGRYLLLDEIASGGMARVHLGRLLGPVNFSRTVAIKCLHPAHGRDAEFVSMLLDEAHLASRIRHPNVVGMLDVVNDGAEIFLVLDYVHGESLAELVREIAARRERICLPVVSSVVSGLLLGLHAAHEATDPELGPLGIVHRDVSPHNVLVGTDGIARVLDFGIAKAASRLQSTGDGQLKGKLRYMSPEQLRCREVNRRTDVFAAATVLWELLVGKRLFDGPDPGAIVGRILEGAVTRPGAVVEGIPPVLDEICMRGLAQSPDERFATAREMAVALERAVAPASAREVGEWVETVAGERLASRAALVARAESGKGGGAGGGVRPGSRPAAAQDATAPHERAVAVAGAEPGPSHDTEAAQTLPHVVHPRHATRIPLPIYALAAAAVLGGIALLSFAGGSGNRDPASAPAATPTSTDTPPTVLAAPAASTDVVAPAAPVESAAAASSSIAAPAGSNPVRSVPRPRAPRADCNPPFVMKDGIKQFKPHCL